MTGIAALNGGAEAYMLTDTLGFDDTGTVTDWRQKAFVIAHLNAVIACRCATDTQLAVFERCQNFDSFDEMVVQLPAKLFDALNSQTGRFKESVRLAFFSGDADFALGFAPLVALPQLSEEQLTTCGIPATPDTPVEPASSLFRMVDCQRKEFGGIGGAAVLTLLRRNFICQRVIHRWPDELGGTVRVGTAAEATQP